VADAENRGKVKRLREKTRGLNFLFLKRGKWNVSAGVGGNGYLTVIKDLGLKRPLISKVPLVSGEIAEDIAYYYAKSEQASNGNCAWSFAETLSGRPIGPEA